MQERGRGRSGRDEGRRGFRGVAEDEGEEGAYGEGGDGADEDVPGEGCGSAWVGWGKPEVKVQGEAGDHAEDCSELGGVACEGAEEEDSEEAAVGYGGYGEAGFDYVARPPCWME